MPRSEARLQFGIWSDGLASRGPLAKLLYAVLLTEPTLNNAGVCAWRLSRWARSASLTAEETEKALAELADGDPTVAQVVYDLDTEELLVRTIIRHDRVASQPWMLKNAIASALAVSSPTLRRVLAAELRKLPPRPPDGVSKAGRPIVYPDPHAAADVLDPGPPTDTANPSKRVSEPIKDPSPKEPTENPSRRHSGSGSGSGSGSCSVGGSVEKATTRNERAVKGPDVFAQRSHSSIAYRLVSAYAKTCRRRPPASVLSQLGVEVDALLAEDWPPTDIAAALTALGAKGLGPRLLASVANELANSGGRERDPYTVPSEELTHEDVEAIIGREAPPEPPIEIVESGDRDERRKWYANAMAAWHADRRDRAVDVRTRRLANVSDLDERRRSG